VADNADAQVAAMTRKAKADVDVSGGVADGPVDHINLLKVSFSSQIAATPHFFSATVHCTVSCTDRVCFH
jgi:hypothetical protein